MPKLASLSAIISRTIAVGLGSQQTIADIVAGVPDVTLIRMPVNGGKGRAVREGIARASGESPPRSRSAACRQPSVRMKRSSSSEPAPKTSDSRPAEIRRQTSICHIRSWA